MRSTDRATADEASHAGGITNTTQPPTAWPHSAVLMARGRQVESGSVHGRFRDLHLLVVLEGASDGAVCCNAAVLKAVWCGSVLGLLPTSPCSTFPLLGAVFVQHLHPQAQGRPSTPYTDRGRAITQQHINTPPHDHANNDSALQWLASRCGCRGGGGMPLTRSTALH